jgi:hypothetical protein
MQRAGHVEELRCHHFGGIVSWIGGKRRNKFLSLVINFFLGRSTKSNKTLVHCPRPTPSKEAPGGKAG